MLKSLSIFGGLLLVVVAMPVAAQGLTEPVFSISAGDVTEAAVGTSPRARLSVTLTPAKSAELSEVTSRNRSKQLKIVVCGSLRAEPVIREQIPGPTFEIFVRSHEEAIATVKCLLASSVPFEQLRRWTDASGETHYSASPAGPAAGGAALPAPSDPAVFKPLQGSWRVHGATMNGRPLRDPAMLDGTWRFEGSTLTMLSPRKGTVQFNLR